MYLSVFHIYVRTQKTLLLCTSQFQWMSSTQTNLGKILRTSIGLTFAKNTRAMGKFKIVRRSFFIFFFAQCQPDEFPCLIRKKNNDETCHRRANLNLSRLKMLWMCSVASSLSEQTERHVVMRLGPGLTDFKFVKYRFYYFFYFFVKIRLVNLVENSTFSRIVLALNVCVCVCVPCTRKNHYIGKVIILKTKNKPKTNRCQHAKWNHGKRNKTKKIRMLKINFDIDIWVVIWHQHRFNWLKLRFVWKLCGMERTT